MSQGILFRGKELHIREDFAASKAPEDREERNKFREERKANAERLKDVKRELKALEKLAAGAEEKCAGARQQADREIALAREAARGASASPFSCMAGRRHPTKKAAPPMRGARPDFTERRDS